MFVTVAVAVAVGVLRRHLASIARVSVPADAAERLASAVAGALLAVRPVLALVRKYPGTFILLWINDADRPSYYCGLTMLIAVHTVVDQ